MTARGWRPLYAPAARRRPLALAMTLAERLVDVERVEAAVRAARAASSEPFSIRWSPCGIAQGDAGLALMFGAFDACFDGYGFDRVAHGWLERAVRGMETAADLSGGLFDGVSGLAFTAWTLSRDGRRYQTLTAKLHDAVLDRLPRMLDVVAHGPGSFLQWDLIAGFTGVGAYLLARRDTEALGRVLDALVALSHEQDGLPRWHTPAGQVAGDWMRARHPHGLLNAGLAHGVAGPLALLSLARSQGFERDGQAGAIARLAAWLMGHSVADRWGVNWPNAVPLVADGGRVMAGSAGGLPPTHAAWCYGSPGVARALWLAGTALDDPRLCALALDAVAALHRRPEKARMLTSPALCHGTAGLLSIMLRFRHDAPNPALERFCRALLRRLVSQYEPDTLLGYRATEPGDVRIDQAGLLDGSAGVALALLAAATNIEPAWDRAFLLS